LAITIESVGPEDAPFVFETVLALLEELGGEADDLGELDAQRVRKAWEASPERVHAFLARTEDGSAAGLVTATEAFAIYANGPYGIVDEMYVFPAHRSRGVGRALLDAVKDLARRKGWSRIDVTAPESEAFSRTRRFYEREGFTFAGPKLKFIRR
jgi:GNAT superfamily N-acetyltransferase